jgi:hypothetical protein
MVLIVVLESLLLLQIFSLLFTSGDSPFIRNFFNEFFSII